MSGDNRTPRTPSPEAYGRVTNPERFASLYGCAAALLDRLASEFDVDRAEGFGLDPELEQNCRLARATVSLAPRVHGAAPLVIAFSTFPGLRVRFGKWTICAFPSCGCDACNETAEGEAARLMYLVDSVITGRFREAIRDSDSGKWQESEFSSAFACSQLRSRPHPGNGTRPVAGGDKSSYDWTPWPKRLRPIEP